MINEETIKRLKDILEEVTETDDSVCYVTSDDTDALKAAIEALEIQPSDEYISKTEVINAIHNTIYEFFDIADDVSEEPMNDKDKLLLTINKALSNAVKALPSVTPQPFINKPCVSEGSCREDKIQVLDKIRAELIQSIQNGMLKIESGNEELFHIIDKYGSESEVNRNDNKI